MPAAKRSTRSSSRTSKFKEPAALKRLTKSLDTAQDALTELSKQGGRDVGQGAGAIYKDLRTFLSSARRNSGKLGKALARDFEQAQKKVAKATSSGGSSRTSSARGGSARSGASRTTASRSGSASRARSTRTTAKRASSTRTKSRAKK